MANKKQLNHTNSSLLLGYYSIICGGGSKPPPYVRVRTFNVTGISVTYEILQALRGDILRKRINDCYIILFPVEPCQNILDVRIHSLCINPALP